jgi:hypothetical protein
MSLSTLVCYTYGQGDTDVSCAEVQLAGGHGPTKPD